jgi:hypothetical protein
MRAVLVAGIPAAAASEFHRRGFYVVNRGTRLPVKRELNNTAARYLSTSRVRDQKTVDFLSASFPSPLVEYLHTT